MVVNGLFKSINDKEMESMAYRIAVVDDEEDDLKHVCHHISDFFSSTDIEVNTYMNAYSEHSIFCLTSQIFTNLSDAPLFFLPKVFTLFKKGIQFLNKNKKDIGLNEIMLSV